MVIFFIAIGSLMVLGPFWGMGRKGAQYATNNSKSHLTFLGSVLWFTILSWTIIGAAGHGGAIALPWPSIIALPIILSSSDPQSFIILPYEFLTKYGYLIPALHLLTFYLFYYLTLMRLRS